MLAITRGYVFYLMQTGLVMADHFSAALSLGSTFDPRIDIWLWWYRAPAANYIYILLIFQQWSELEPSPSFPSVSTPRFSMDSMDKKPCKKPLFSCTVEFPWDFHPKFCEARPFCSASWRSWAETGQNSRSFLEGIFGAGKLIIEFVIIKNTRNLSSVLKLQLGRFERFWLKTSQNQSKSILKLGNRLF